MSPAECVQCRQSFNVDSEIATRRTTVVGTKRREATRLTASEGGITCDFPAAPALRIVGRHKGVAVVGRSRRWRRVLAVLRFEPFGAHGVLVARLPRAPQAATRAENTRSGCGGQSGSPLAWLRAAKATPTKCSISRTRVMGRRRPRHLRLPAPVSGCDARFPPACLAASVGSVQLEGKTRH